MVAYVDFLREYKGTAGDQVLAGNISPSDMSLAVDGSSGWPTGAHPFVITINAGGASEEKILCSTRTGNTLSVQNRGWDGTSAASHAAGEKVQHTDSAYDFTVFNAHTSSANGVHGMQGNMVDDSTAQSLANKTLVSPAQDDFTNAQHDHSSAAQGGSAGLMRVPGGSLQAHLSGNQPFTYAPGGVSIAHGATFTPTFAVVMMVDWLTTWTSTQVVGVDATNVGFKLFNGATESSAGNCHVRLLVFA